MNFRIRTAGGNREKAETLTETFRTFTAFFRRLLHQNRSFSLRDVPREVKSPETSVDGRHRRPAETVWYAS